jgi:hypothetical protein
VGDKWRLHPIANFGNVGEMPEALAAELLEVFNTRVLIIDDRVADRLKSRSSIHDQFLRLQAYSETLQNWEFIKTRLSTTNILVVHLSFIEKFKDENGLKLYSEMDIRDFVEKEILNGEAPKENFVLVISTGRGRTEWLEAMKTEIQPRLYTNFVMLRPIESILAAVEDGLSIDDDVEIKYKLIKTLLGS